MFSFPPEEYKTENINSGQFFDGRESIYIEFYLGNDTWIPYC